MLKSWNAGYIHVFIFVCVKFGNIQETWYLLVNILLRTTLGHIVEASTSRDTTEVAEICHQAYPILKNLLRFQRKKERVHHI